MASLCYNRWLHLAVIYPKMQMIVKMVENAKKKDADLSKELFHRIADRNGYSDMSADG